MSATDTASHASNPPLDGQSGSMGGGVIENPPLDGGAGMGAASGEIVNPPLDDVPAGAAAKPKRPTRKPVTATKDRKKSRRPRKKD